MTNQDRRRAFDLRLAGHSWEDIAQRLGYCRNTVERDLRRCITRPGVNLCRVVYPALQHYISYYYEGSLAAFCAAVGYPRNKGCKILHGELPMEAEFIRLVGDRTGLLESEITGKKE